MSLLTLFEACFEGYGGINRECHPLVSYPPSRKPLCEAIAEVSMRKLDEFVSQNLSNMCAFFAPLQYAWLALLIDPSQFLAMWPNQLKLLLETFARWGPYPPCVGGDHIPPWATLPLGSGSAALLTQAWAR